MGKGKKALAVSLCLAACLTAAPARAMAAEPYAQPKAVHDTGIMPLMEYIRSDDCKLSLKNGALSVNAYVTGGVSLTTKCEITVELQEKSLLTWKTVATWSDTQDSFRAAVNESYAGTAGKSYRAVATVTVWSGSASETKTLTSDAVKV